MRLNPAFTAIAVGALALLCTAGIRRRGAVALVVAGLSAGLVCGSLFWAGWRGHVGALRGLVQGIIANGSLVVVRTHPGSAAAIARAIDLGEVPEVLGTIAGDDTIFVAPAPDIRPRRLAARLAEILGTPRALRDGPRTH